MKKCNILSSTLIQIKAFLGKYYPELAYAVAQDKYSKLNLGRFFEQRFSIQNNKTQMIVDPGLKGLQVIISGNEIHISKELFDHPGVDVTNSMENQGVIQNNPKSLYTPDVFSTVAYLICQNHTMFQIISEIEEPIYIKYTTEFESFYNSVVVVNIMEDIEVEIIEEYESCCALNTVTNYIVQTNAKLNLTTFYQNHLSALSFCLRNIIIQDNAKYSHTLFGKGSSIILDETKILANAQSSIELFGCIDPRQNEFNVIVGIQPGALDYNFMLDHRHIVYGRGKATFTPVVIGHLPADAHSNVSSISLDQVPVNLQAEKIEQFLLPITSRSTLERIIGSQRYYKNKSKFLHFDTR